MVGLIVEVPIPEDDMPDRISSAPAVDDRIDVVDGICSSPKLDKGKGKAAAGVDVTPDCATGHASGSDGTATPAHDIAVSWQDGAGGNSEGAGIGVLPSPRTVNPGDADLVSGSQVGDVTGRTSDHEIEAEEEADLEDDEIPDWTTYEPPEALSTLQRETSEILQRVVEQSIQNIRDQIAEVERVRLEQQEAEEKRKAEEEIKRAEDEAAEAARQLTPEPGSIPEIRVLEPPQAPTETPKKLKPLARLLRHVATYERGESSAAGARRYMSRSASSDMVQKLAPTSAPRQSGPRLLRRLKAKEKVAVEVIGETVECTSCFDDIPASLSIKTTCHSYCPDCFERLIMTAVENEAQWPPKCCLNEVPPKLITKHVSKGLAKVYIKKADEFKVPTEDRLYCPHPDCGVFVPKSHITLGSRTAKCSRGHSTCTICRQASHGRGSCPQDYELQRTERLAEEEGWRRCIRCGVLIEHRDACQHMTCRCGGEFCYVCGAPWRTCACGMDELMAVKNAAARRRQERTATEVAEERELREALRQIEEFEREEARKAELLRLEQERIAEERRARELEEQMRREAIRRVEVQERFEIERRALDELNSMQENLIRFQHDRERIDLTTKATAETAALTAQNERDLAATRAATTAKIERHAAEWKADFCARVLAERTLEDAYRDKLAGMWLERDDREARVEKAMYTYMRRNDERMDEYSRWREREVAAHRFRCEEALAIREELMEHAAKQLKKRCARGERDRVRRQEAEMKWVEAVVVERGRLLVEMEETERDIGGEVMGDGESFWSLPSESEDGRGEEARRAEDVRRLDEEKKRLEEAIRLAEEILPVRETEWPLREGARPPEEDVWRMRDVDENGIDDLVTALRPPGSYVH